MSEQLLTGCDGDLYLATEGTPVTTGTLVADTEYIVTATGSGSALSSTLVGYKYIADGTEVLVAGDSVTPLTFTIVGYIDSAEINPTRDKYTVTALGNCSKGYIAGLTDVAVTFSGTLDLQDDQQELIENQFLSYVRDNTVTEKNSDDLLMKIVFNDKSTTSGEINKHYFGPFVADNFSTNASAEDKSNLNYSGTVNGSSSTKFAVYTEEVA